jgi:hypothetical protein
VATIAACLAIPIASAAPAGAAGSYPGKLDIRHTDDFRHKQSSTRYTLRQARNKRFVVRPRLVPNVPSGARVIVRGKRRGRIIAGNVKARPGVRPAAAPLGDYKVAVLLFNFTDDRSQPWTTAAVEDRFFNDANSVDVFFEEQSWNQVSLSGAVYGWYALDISGAGCNEDAYAAAAESAAAAEDVPLGAYDSIAYVFPDQYDCGWAGLAELPGDQLWLNGDISVRVASHELGHNMGVHHAASLRCTSGGTGVAISSSCTMNEYGDPFSSMGSSGKRMAGWHLQQLGYMQPANVQTVTSSGTYTVRTTATQSGDVQLLKIPRTPTGWPAEYYYVDLRAPNGVFDTFGLGDPAVNGVTLRIGHDPTTRLQSKLIDTVPSTSSYLDAPLTAGRTFSDGNLSITTVSVASGEATVDVDWDGGPTPDIEPPSAPSIIAATHHGSYVDLSWSGSTDNVAVAGYRVKRNGSTIATVVGTSHRDYAVSAYGDYVYCVEAFDAAGNSRASELCRVPGPFVPPSSDPGPDPGGSAPPPPPPDSGGGGPAPPPADVTPPSVRIAAPGRNARLHKRATVRASAKDAVGVEVIELWVDKVRLATRRGGKLKLRWNLKRVRRGRHKVMIVARDAAGNTSRRTVKVRVTR